MASSVFRWSSFSSDPNASAVLARRNATLAAARQPPVASRTEYLTGLVRGREILDIGVIEHQIESSSSSRWLHRQLAEAAERCVGVDVLVDEVEELRGRGFDVRCHDLSTGPLDEQFDVIVAGEVVEHLDAPVAVLSSARQMLRTGGRIVVTTPNPYMVHRAWKHLRGGFPDSADHSLLLGPSQMLELASRADLVLDAWRGVRLRDLPGLRNRVASVARRALSPAVLAPETGCETLIYELVPPVS
jgi:SAM-dependent methyltransferase